MDEQSLQVQHHVAEEEEEPPGLLSARTVDSPDASAENDLLKGDEEGQSRRDAQPGTLARIIQRYDSHTRYPKQIIHRHTMPKLVHI